MSYTQITGAAPALDAARYAVLIDGREEMPQMRFAQLAPEMDVQSIAGVAALAPGDVLSMGVVEIRRVV